MKKLIVALLCLLSSTYALADYAELKVEGQEKTLKFNEYSGLQVSGGVFNNRQSTPFSTIKLRRKFSNDQDAQTWQNDIYLTGVLNWVSQGTELEEVTISWRPPGMICAVKLSQVKARGLRWVKDQSGPAQELTISSAAESKVLCGSQAQPEPNEELVVESLPLFFNTKTPLKVFTSNGEKVTSLEVKNGELVSQNENTFEVIAKAREVELSYTDGFGKKYVKKLNAFPIPKPKVQILIGGRPVSTVRGLRVNQIRTATTRVVPDEFFEANFPQDARYRVAQGKVTLANGVRPVGSPVTFTSSTINFARFRNQARSGYRLVIEVTRVIRVSSENKFENVAVDFEPISIPIF